MSDEEFEDQLEQEKKAKVEEEEREVVHQGRTYTDADGTVMEWDPVKKAYFPQVKFCLSVSQNCRGVRRSES